ncbi:MAG: hypothetical protein QG635_27 [Bacteroidota bacterium]|nr:hypothetical protein [Bacteroidota bacterium]
MNIRFSFVIILIILISPLYGFQDISDKIINDLVGQTIQTTNEEISWTFKNGDLIQYVVLDQRATGPKNFKRIDYLIYIRTRRTSSDEGELLRAEGILKLTYKKSQSRNHNYLSSIEQSGFHVKNMTLKEKEIFAQLDLFWLEFKNAVSFNYQEQVAEMFRYPFESENFGNYASKADLMKSYDKVFTDEVKVSIKHSILAPEKKSKGKEFDFEKDDYIQICNYEEQVVFNGLENLFVVGNVDGKFKIVRVIMRQPSTLLINK